MVFLEEGFIDFEQIGFKAQESIRGYRYGCHNLPSQLIPHIIMIVHLFHTTEGSGTVPS